ncbi:MAG: BTAD domain-containing putative transcriptional regulator, partial [Candidatus Eiseniibacteriota bacterium]
MESDRSAATAAAPALHVRMLGPMTVSRDGGALALPSSRKVRAMIAYLALAPHPVARSHLCELLWDVPDDPRGELRWCLSKIRRILDEPGRRRVETGDDTVRLDLSDCFVDALEIGGALQAGIETLPEARLKALCDLFAGEFLDGLEIDRSPQFDGWVAAQRRRLRAGQAAMLEQLIKRLPHDSELVFGCLERWLELAPFDRRAHESLLGALARAGRIREGEEHLAATAKLFEAEGFDWSPLRDAWRAARARPSIVPASSGGLILPSESSPVLDIAAAPASRRASIAVMPFVDRGADNGARGGLGDGLAHDVITRLAKLRSLFVIAQGTVFALGERGVGPAEAGRTLNVDYVANGALRRRDRRIGVEVELTETR